MRNIPEAIDIWHPATELGKYTQFTAKDYAQLQYMEWSSLCGSSPGEAPTSPQP